ncbi:MAG: hypothetical protein JWM21_1918 [Acidobacteria bacterium]|nr:hypothetical protein [Acidobacteriota bacterium]
MGLWRWNINLPKSTERISIDASLSARRLATGLPGTARFQRACVPFALVAAEEDNTIDAGTLEACGPRDTCDNIPPARNQKSQRK